MSLIKPLFAKIKNPIYPNDIATETPKTFFNQVLSTVFSVFLIVAVVYFVWHFVMAAFHIMDSRGDAKKLETAKEELLNAFIGLAITFSIFALLRFIATIFGMPELKQLQIPWPNLL